MWNIGQRVLCVDDSGHKTHLQDVKPKKGTVYTIRTIEDNCYQCLGIRLMEIVNTKRLFRSPLGVEFAEVCFHENRFKPLDEKRIDIFRAMLKNKEKEKVE